MQSSISLPSIIFDKHSGNIEITGLIPLFTCSHLELLLRNSNRIHVMCLTEKYSGFSLISFMPINPVMQSLIPLPFIKFVKHSGKH